MVEAGGHFQPKQIRRAHFILEEHICINMHAHIHIHTENKIVFLLLAKAHKLD